MVSWAWGVDEGQEERAVSGHRMETDQGAEGNGANKLISLKLLN